MSAADRDGWSVRIGDDAAELVQRAATAQRAGVAAGLLFVALEIAFQLAGYYRPGIIGSVIFFVGSMFALFYAIRLQARARRLIAARLGLPPSQAKWVRVRQGTAGYGRWLAARNRPGWPATGWR